MEGGGYNKYHLERTRREGRPSGVEKTPDTKSWERKRKKKPAGSHWGQIAKSEAARRGAKRPRP